MLGITSLAALGHSLLLSETDTENSQEVTISGLHIYISFNASLPLLDHGTEFVSGQIKAMEVAEYILSLNFLSNETELSETPFSIIPILTGEGINNLLFGPLLPRFVKSLILSHR